jgi:TolB-like protein
MTLFLKYWSLIIVFLTLPACTFFEPNQTLKLCADDNGNFTSCTGLLIENQKSKQHPSLFTSDIHFVLLGEYTQQIAIDLKNDIPISGLNGSVIVLPFIYSNGLINEAETLRQDLAEYLTNDLRDLGVATSDQSLAGYLYKTEQGYIEFSAEQQEAFSELNASYVLAGNIRKINSGLMLKTKIIELKSGRLVASNTKLLPNLVVKSLL